MPGGATCRQFPLLGHQHRQPLLDGERNVTIPTNELIVVPIERSLPLRIDRTTEHLKKRLVHAVIVAGNRQAEV